MHRSAALTTVVQGALFTSLVVGTEVGGANTPTPLILGFPAGLGCSKPQDGAGLRPPSPTASLATTHLPLTLSSQGVATARPQTPNA